MKGYALDSNNDLLLKNGSFSTVEDGDYTVQDVRSRLQFYLEEWFLGLNSGTPWFQEIFKKPININNIESIIKTKILETEGVIKLIDFTMELESPNTRKLKIAFSAETIYGVLEGVTINV